MTIFARCTVQFCSSAIIIITLWSVEFLKIPWYASCSALLLVAQNCSMATKVRSDLRLSEYRGCGIRAFSCQADSGDWLPEACFWLYTADGWRRLWIRSFDRFFFAQGVTFRSRKEADDFAFRLARRLIDKTLKDIEESTSPQTAPVTADVSRTWRTRGQLFSIAKIIKQFRNRA